MEDSELAAIAKFVMRDRQYLGALRVREGLITLEQLYFTDEIRSIDGIKPSRSRVMQQELKMAQQLIDSWTTEWKPEKYKGTCRDELLAVIKAKRKGRQTHRAAEVEEAEPTDLMTALSESIEQHKGGRRAKRKAVPHEGRAREASEGGRNRRPLEAEQRTTRSSTPTRRLSRGTAPVHVADHDADGLGGDLSSRR